MAHSVFPFIWQAAVQHRTSGASSLTCSCTQLKKLLTLLLRYQLSTWLIRTRPILHLKLQGSQSLQTYTIWNPHWYSVDLKLPSAPSEICKMLVFAVSQISVRKNFELTADNPHQINSLGKRSCLGKGLLFSDTQCYETRSLGLYKTVL